MMVVQQWRQGGGLDPDMGTPLQLLQPSEAPAKNALERGEKSNGIESGQMLTRVSL
jgi:hypothetical protein